MYTNVVRVLSIIVSRIGNAFFMNNGSNKDTNGYRVRERHTQVACSKQQRKACKTAVAK